MISPKALFISALALVVAALVAAIVLVAPWHQPARHPAGSHAPIFDLLSTSNLCGRLTSADYTTRESALIAMKAFQTSLPEDAADALCLAVLLETIGDEGRENELIDFHLFRHRTVIRKRATTLLSQIKSSPYVTDCDGNTVQPNASGIRKLQDFSER